MFKTNRKKNKSIRRLVGVLLSTVLISCALADDIDSTKAPAQRIVSINLCTDALLLKLVDPIRINSLYYLSANPQFSIFSQQASQFHLNHGLAEEIVPRNPDLILAGEFTSASSKAILRQLGFKVETLALPRTLADISAHIRRFGDVTNTRSAAEKMALEIEQKIESLDSTPNKSAAIPAFWYSSNGVVVGSDTLENELMTRAGFHNLALDKHINGFAQIDLEDVLLAQPRVIIVDASDVQSFSLAREYVQHPALGKNNIRIITLPTTLSCIAPVVVDAIEQLVKQKNQLVY